MLASMMRGPREVVMQEAPMPEPLRLMERGEVDLLKGVSHSLPLSSIPAALALASDPSRDALKIVITPQRP